MSEGNGKKSDPKNKKLIIGLSAVAVVVLVGAASAGGYYFTVKNKVEQWNNKIFPGIIVEDVDLSGMTKEEATQELNNTYGQAILDKKVIVKAVGEEVEIKFNELSPEYNIEDVVTKALAIGKEESVLKQNSYIKSGISNNLNLDFKYNEEKLKDYEAELISKVNQDAKDATISISGGNINVAPSADGRKVNEEEMSRLILESIDGSIGEEVVVEVPVEVTTPAKTTEMLSKVNGIMGTYSTSYSTSNDNRSANIDISTRAINGTLVMPGETFSFNEVVGERTASRGYKPAGTYVGNQVVEGIGGGICQTSTTIGRAVMRAGIKPTARTNHSMKVSYSEYGLDTAVAWGSLDFKFVNTYSSPIYIQGYTGGKTVTFNIYGNTADKGGKTFELVSTPAVVTSEATVKRVEDSSLEKGKEVWDSKAVNAYKSSSYLVTYQNGSEVNREFLSTHNYVKTDGVLRVGTKEVVQEPVPEQPTPETTPEQPAEGTTEQP